MRLDEHCEERLLELRSTDLYRKPRTVTGPLGPEIEVDGHKTLCFTSNDYLGFAGSHELAAALADGARLYGSGSGASRLINGTHDIHLHLEARLARFVGAPSTLLFSTGYAANVGLLQALGGPDLTLFSDRLNHASLIDGIRLSRSPYHVYPHADTQALESILRTHRADTPHAALISDALFSMDGDLAPLEPLLELARRYDAWLILDEAHSLGVLGPHGKGLGATLDPPVDVRIGTLGKAFGTSGAFVAGPSSLRQLLINRARSFVFSTAPSPAIAHATCIACDLVEAADARRKRLHHHANRIRRELRSLGYEVPRGDTPIIPLLLGSAKLTMELSHRLLEAGIFVQGIRPPTVPRGTSRLRIVPSATHTDAHIDALLDAFRSEARR